MHRVPNNWGGCVFRPFGASLIQDFSPAAFAASRLAMWIHSGSIESVATVRLLSSRKSQNPHPSLFRSLDSVDVHSYYIGPSRQKKPLQDDKVLLLDHKLISSIGLPSRLPFCTRVGSFAASGPSGLRLGSTAFLRGRLPFVVW
jgi:hypothetical protein